MLIQTSIVSGAKNQTTTSQERQEIELVVGQTNGV